MMKHLSKLGMIAGVAAASVAAAAARGQNETPMAFHFGMKAGELLRYGFQEIESITTHSDKVRGGVGVNQYQTEAQLTFRVLDSTEERVTVELRYERVRFKGESPILKEPPVFDTASPAEEARTNPLAPALLGIIDRPILIELTPTGKIVGVDAQGIDVPDVKFGGVAEQMTTQEWIGPRFQAVFSLTAPETEAAVSMWTLASEVPVVMGNSQRLRIMAFHVLQRSQGGFAPVRIMAKAELLPFGGEGDNLNATLLSFEGKGDANWEAGAGVLHDRSVSYEWALDTKPQEGLETRTEVRVQSLLARLK